MAFLEIKNVGMAGVSACVPKRIEKSDVQDSGTLKVSDATGIKERRIDDFTTSDLCLAAAERLLDDLHWTREDVDALIFVSQTGDYYLPATACILQDKLHLSKDCFAQDITLGCSGWVYGLSTAAALLSGGSIKKALLLAGDARRHYPTTEPLFGYAGSATALEYREGGSFCFQFGTDGSGCDAIIIPDGGCRNPVSAESFLPEDIDGRKLNRLQTRINGMDVFSFGIRTVPKSVLALTEKFGLELKGFDWCIFHQANKKMNDYISAKLKLDADKVPSSIEYFGNTSSASIPLTMVTRLNGRCAGKKSFLCCGFGVGLSWGTVAFEAEDLFLSHLVEM